MRTSLHLQRPVSRDISIAWMRVERTRLLRLQLSYGRSNVRGAGLHADADDGSEPNRDVVAEPNGRGLDDAMFHGVPRQMHAVADHDAVAWRSGILTGGAR